MQLLSSPCLCLVRLSWSIVSSSVWSHECCGWPRFHQRLWRYYWMPLTQWTIKIYCPFNIKLFKYLSFSSFVKLLTNQILVFCLLFNYTNSLNIQDNIESTVFIIFYTLTFSKTSVSSPFWYWFCTLMFSVSEKLCFVLIRSR